MVLQINERKQDDISGDNFESKFQIQNGNYVKFLTKVDTVYKSTLVGEESNPSLEVSSNNRFYEIINQDGIKRV